MLTNQELEEIIADWSFWETAPESGLSRQVSLPDKLCNDLALIVQGVRRCGKSTLLTQLPGHYNLPFAQCFFCNFEDPRLLQYLDFNLLAQIVKLARQRFDAKQPCYFFFDEIQNVAGWEKWLHTQLERPKQNFYVVTGSNSALLAGEFGTTLTGRHITLELFPFTFSEFKKYCPKKNFEDYLHSGGFPRPLSYAQPCQLLQEYFSDIILRDVVKRVNARTPEAIKQVVQMAYECCGSELSYRKIAAATSLGVDTVKSYLEASEQAYLLFACPFFAFSEKKRQLRQKKYYPIDSGLRNAVTSTSTRDLGKSLELMVYLYLRQKFEQVCYWQETHKGEVDFVIMHGQKITPYQVTWNKPEARHMSALDAFYEQFPHAQEAIFVTKDNATDLLGT